MKTFRLESQDQTALMTWAGFNANRHPELELLHAIPNGGLRNARVAHRMKQEGIKAGVPDLSLPVARGGYHGLYLEMKTEANRPKRAGSKGGLSDLQLKWIERLREQGFRVAVCYGYKEAVATLEGYLNS